MKNDLDHVLRMAARVMGLAALAGCQLPADELTEGDGSGLFGTDPDTDPTDPPGTTPADTATTDDTGCKPDIKVVEVDPRDDRQICEDQVNEAILEYTFGSDDLDCCVVLMDAEEAFLKTPPYTAGFPSYEQRNPCCMAMMDAGLKVPIACTPWGPPCPPSMREIA
jgi:hypothetical protein